MARLIHSPSARVPYTSKYESGRIQAVFVDTLLDKSAESRTERTTCMSSGSRTVYGSSSQSKLLDMMCNGGLPEQSP